MNLYKKEYRLSLSQSSHYYNQSFVSLKAIKSTPFYLPPIYGMGAQWASSSFIFRAPWGSRKPKFSLASASLFEPRKIWNNRYEEKSCNTDLNLCKFLLSSVSLNKASEFRVFIRISKSPKTWTSLIPFPQAI